MNAEEFTILTGGRPVDDDLERASCPLSGQTGHYHCGVCPRCGQPRWMCAHGGWHLSPVMQDLSSDMEPLDDFEIGEARQDSTLSKVSDATLRINEALRFRLDTYIDAIY